MTAAPSRTLLAAAAACALALLVFGAALTRALGLAPGRADTFEQPAVAAAAHIEQPAPLSADALLLAVDNDPFQPDRQRPPGRYRLPGDVDPPPPPPPPAAPPPPAFRLVGTAVAADGGLALIQLADEPARLLASGEWLAGYRLGEITPQSAVMANDERALTLRLADAQQRGAPQAAAQQQRGGMMRGQGQGGGPGGGPGARAGGVEAPLIEALIQRARQNGANDAMIQALQRMIEQRGIGAVGDISIQDGRMIIRSGDGRSMSTFNMGPNQTPPPPPRRPDTLSAPLRLDY
jgi:hypothetical protein